jgi:hypothetical protein
VRVGALSYLQYAAELENRDGLNTFDVTRAYLNINAQVMKNVRFPPTPDIRRITDGSLAGRLTVRIKYGFAQLDNRGREGTWARWDGSRFDRSPIGVFSMVFACRVLQRRLVCRRSTASSRNRDGQP